MKLSKSKLQQIVREELKAVQEGYGPEGEELTELLNDRVDELEQASRDLERLKSRGALQLFAHDNPKDANFLANAIQHITEIINEVNRNY